MKPYQVGKYRIRRTYSSNGKEKFEIRKMKGLRDTEYITEEYSLEEAIAVVKRWVEIDKKRNNNTWISEDEIIASKI